MRLRNELHHSVALCEKIAELWRNRELRIICILFHIAQALMARACEFVSCEWHSIYPLRKRDVRESTLIMASQFARTNTCHVSSKAGLNTLHTLFER